MQPSGQPESTPSHPPAEAHEPAAHENRRSVRITELGQQGQERDWAGTTIEQRWAAMWQLALDAWAFKGEPVEPRLPRHIVRVQRSRG